jgi:hypothetical protein
MSARTVAMQTISLLVMWVVEDGDDAAYDLLVETTGAADADELIKVGRSVNRRLGTPVFVRGLIPETCGGGQ